MLLSSIAAVTLSTTFLGTSGLTFNPTQETVVYAKAKQATLIPGSYKVGSELKPGRYTITSSDGSSGNISSMPKKSLHGDTINEILGSETDMSQVPSVTATLAKGDKVKIEGLTSATFTPVKKRNKKNNTALATGSWIVGKDIKKGKYTVTPVDGQSGNFIVIPKSTFGDTTNEVLGGDTDMSQVPKVNVKLHNGDKVEVAGMTQVNFAKR
ncbi:hypothetical protein CBP76_07305 [Companilactobacillus nuruki]|uniref:Uncharacterized protein n=1 Tax=Companilactobacillus nuruki TaxID=1993540 RepID=A0A2N7AU36_9LACO|nr:hypothetical protein CBP76_07305 [Companilactobacillus nuruki]